MILSNTAMRRLIEKGELFVGSDAKTPLNLDQLSFDTTTLNVHLADEFTVWKDFGPGTRISVDPGAIGFDFKKHGSDFTRTARADRDGCYEVRRNEFLLCITREYIKLPLALAARIEGRSSLGRVGLGVHVTAPTIHAGFEGCITLEIFNHSSIPVILRPGMKIAQLIIEKVEGIPVVEQQQNFINQINAVGDPTIAPGSKRKKVS